MCPDVLVAPRCWGAICLKLSFKLFRHLRDQLLVALIPTPMSLALGLHQASLLEDPHVMGNSRLRELHPLFNVRCAQPGFLPDRASALFFERAQNAPARRVSNRVQKAIQIGR